MQPSQEAKQNRCRAGALASLLSAGTTCITAQAPPPVSPTHPTPPQPLGKLSSMEPVPGADKVGGGHCRGWERRVSLEKITVTE